MKDRIKIIIMLPLLVLILLPLMVIDLVRKAKGKPTVDEEWHSIYMDRGGKNNEKMA